ncbi:P-selectin glycoprotein ligand 1 [Dromaius novaehollandiae]|uniref:P-selectin glycoprotein ligand 1 n=1 Tax=Dromaius novaehollandiae TaxID=8790 RepID=UPI00311E56F3
MAARGAALLLLPLLLLPGARGLRATATEEEEGNELPPLSRWRRDVGEWPSNATAGYPGTAATAGGGGNSSEPAWLPGSAAPGTDGSLQHALAAPTAAEPLDEADPDPLPSSGAPGTNSSLPPAVTAPATTEPPDETDPVDPDLLPGSAAPGTNATLPRAFAVPTTTEPPDETGPPDPDLLPGSAAPGTNATLPRAFAVPTTTEPPDETDPPDPDLLPSSTAMPGNSTEQPAAADTSSGGRPERSSPAPTRPGQRDTAQAGETPGEGAVGVLMGKCLLAIFLLALVAAAFIVCTAVLGALLWRRQRAGGRRPSRTELVCISSLLPDGEPAANGARPGPAKRPKLLPEPGSEAEGDDLTLSSFLPDHP